MIVKAMHFRNAQVATVTIENASEGCHKICLKDNLWTCESIILQQDELRDFIERCHETYLKNNGCCAIYSRDGMRLMVTKKNHTFVEVSMAEKWGSVRSGDSIYLSRSQMIDFRHMLIAAFVEKEEEVIANILEKVNKFKKEVNHD